MNTAAGVQTLHAWRHPRAEGAAGRCIGHTDLPVDPRRAKRLAHRIRQQARRLGLPRIVVTSHLARCRCVGHWLARWGWQHRIDPALTEVHFGTWDGQHWADIPRAAVDAWCEDFLHHAPGGGESVAQVLSRVRGFDPGRARVVVTHGGWLSAAQWIAACGDQTPTAGRWPQPPRQGSHAELALHATGIHGSVHHASAQSARQG